MNRFATEPLPQYIETPIVPTATIYTKQPPTSVLIPKIHRDLPIQAAVVQDNQWQLFDTSVAWLSTSAVPGESGVIVLYAHNWAQLWRDIYTLEVGDEIIVRRNLQIYEYRVVESRAVTPSDVTAVVPEDNLLVLYTCEGRFDQKRRVVYAKAF